MIKTHSQPAKLPEIFNDKKRCEIWYDERGNRNEKDEMDYRLE